MCDFWDYGDVKNKQNEFTSVFKKKVIEQNIAPYEAYLSTKELYKDEFTFYEYDISFVPEFKNYNSFDDIYDLSIFSDHIAHKILKAEKEIGNHVDKRDFLIRLFCPMTNGHELEYFTIGINLRALLLDFRQTDYSQCIGVCSKYTAYGFYKAMMANNLKLESVELPFKMIILESKPKVSVKNRYNF